MTNLNTVILSFEDDELEIIKSNAENMIDDISKASDVIDSKANTYFSVLLLVIVSCLGYLVKNINTIDFSSLIIHEISILIVISFIALYHIYLMLLPTDYKLKGTKPEFHINYDGYGSDKKKEILKDTITTLQTIIDHNISVHEKRVERLKIAIDFIVSGIFFAIIYAIFYFGVRFLFLQ